MPFLSRFHLLIEAISLPAEPADAEADELLCNGAMAGHDEEGMAVAEKAAEVADDDSGGVVQAEEEEDVKEEEREDEEDEREEESEEEREEDKQGEEVEAEDEAEADNTDSSAAPGTSRGKLSMKWVNSRIFLWSSAGCWRGANWTLFSPTWPPGSVTDSVYSIKCLLGQATIREESLKQAPTLPSYSW